MSVEFDCTSSIFDSLPTVSLEPSIDIDKFNDPEEFFVAFEKAESKFSAPFRLSFLLGNLIC